MEESGYAKNKAEFKKRIYKEFDVYRDGYEDQQGLRVHIVVIEPATKYEQGFYTAHIEDKDNDMQTYGYK